MNIRFAQKSDVKQIIQLCELHAAYENVVYNSQNKEVLLSKHIFEDSSLVKCLVVEYNAQIIGYATFFKQFSTWDANHYVYLDCLFFKEEMRGQGLGTRLMEEVKAYCKSENCDHIQWQTPDFNQAAIKFYKNLGAESKAKERFFWSV